MIINKIISFLVQVSFPDIYIFRKVLLPFLFELVEKNKEELDVLLRYILIILDKKPERQEFVTKLFDCNYCYK